jgi:hypothetical protein
MLIFTAVYTTQDLGPHNLNGQGCVSCHASPSVDSNAEASSYMWGDFSHTTYTTVAGTTFTMSTDTSDEDPGIHSAACLACHDGELAPSGSGPVVSALSGHPVNVPYVLGTAGHWPGTVTQSGVQFGASNFDNVYGRPLRFYVSGGVAYIECGTCHDPHHHTTATVTINGQSYDRPTAHFVRGWFDEMNPNSNSAAQFCRACHYEMSNEAYGGYVPTR